MLTTLKYSQVKELTKILEKLGDVPAAGSAFVVARNIIALRPLVEAVDKVDTSVSGFISFSKEQAALLEKYAKRDAAGNPVRVVFDTPQGKMAQYEIEDTTALNTALAPLLEKYATAIKDEQERVTTLPEAMAQEVEVELSPMDGEWCSGILNAHEIVVLLDCQLCKLD